MGRDAPEGRLPQGRRKHAHVPPREERRRRRATGEPQGDVAVPDAGRLGQLPARSPRQAGLG